MVFVRSPAEMRVEFIGRERRVSRNFPFLCLVDKNWREIGTGELLPQRTGVEKSWLGRCRQG